MAGGADAALIANRMSAAPPFSLEMIQCHWPPTQGTQSMHRPYSGLTQDLPLSGLGWLGSGSGGSQWLPVALSLGVKGAALSDRRP